MGMRLKRMCRRMDRILMFLLVAGCILAGILFRLSVQDCGIASIQDLSDIEEGMVTVTGIWTGREGDGGITKDSFGSGADPYGVEAAPVIAVASATGKLRQTEGSLGQEIRIEEVIRGGELVECGETGYLYQYFGFQEVDGRIQYGNLLNLMQPGERYLVFLEESPLNIYQKKAAYLLASDFFGYVKIGGQETATLAAGQSAYDFTLLKAYEFFSVSEDTTEVLNAIRKEILDRYYGA